MEQCSPLVRIGISPPSNPRKGISCCPMKSLILQPNPAATFCLPPLSVSESPAISAFPKHGPLRSTSSRARSPPRRPAASAYCGRPTATATRIPRDGRMGETPRGSHGRCPRPLLTNRSRNSRANGTTNTNSRRDSVPRRAGRDFGAAWNDSRKSPSFAFPQLSLNTFVLSPRLAPINFSPSSTRCATAFPRPCDSAPDLRQTLDRSPWTVDFLLRMAAAPWAVDRHHPALTASAVWEAAQHLESVAFVP